ncbi:MAG: 3-oxoacyl-ACP reductase family protein [Thermodesulfobacteriota bacterium]|jgi:NAD(P)-dependent dehydrogenase (short-subunit alcohol dehydrogenase family)
MRLRGRVALITGSSRGIGRATAIRFAEEGASIVVNYIQNGDKADEVKRLIENMGGKAITVKADVANRTEVKEMIDKALEHFCRLDILVNNVGVPRDALIYKMTEEDWDFAINVNLKGSFNCVQFASVPMVKQKYGKIINISSGAYKGHPGQANYSAAKSGLVGLTKTLAMELARFNINVNCVVSGLVETEVIRGIEKGMFEKMVERTILKRIAQPVEIANVILFLASDESSYVTGQIIEARGGAP